MPQDLTWDNAEDIGILLSQTHPDLTPLAVSLTDLRQYVTALPGFKDDSTTPAESKLKAIQKAWHEEFQDKTKD